MSKTSFIFKLTHSMEPLTILKTVIYAVFSFILPIKGLFLLAIFITFFDAFVAWWASKKIGEKVCSNTTLDYIKQGAIFIFAIITGYMIDLYIIEGSITLPYVKITIDYFCSKLTCFLVTLNVGQRINENWVKAGNESLWKSLKDFLTGVRSIKKDIDEIKKDKKDE